jgi:hypothetical protein
MMVVVVVMVVVMVVVEIVVVSVPISGARCWCCYYCSTLWMGDISRVPLFDDTSFVVYVYMQYTTLFFLARPRML